MKSRLNLTVALALVALILAVVQYTRLGRLPNGSVVVLIVIFLVLGARYAVRRQTQNRSEILKDVPKRPLGLTDDSTDNHS